MSSELERRLEGLLAAAPEPDPGAGEEALHRALQALRPAAPARRGLRTAVLAFAAAVVLLAITAGSLAGAGALHVSFGAKKKPRPVKAQLALPKGAHGIAAIVDGRLSVVTRGGRMQGKRVSSAALSPRALYVAAGIGRSLVAMAPDGQRAWSHAAGGKVVAIAWAPDGFRIAYVVRHGHRLALHVIWGTGTHDTLIDRTVRAVRPSWRADSLAVAYVGVGGRAVVYDLGHASHKVVPTAARDVTSIAFAPQGSELAVAAGRRIRLIGMWRTILPSGRAGFGWLGPDELAMADGYDVAILPGHRALIFGGRIVGLGTGADRFVAAVVGRSPRIVAGTTAHTQTVLTLPSGARVEDLEIG
jgi:hypothetical protein